MCRRVESAKEVKYLVQYEVVLDNSWIQAPLNKPELKTLREREKKGEVKILKVKEVYGGKASV